MAGEGRGTAGWNVGGACAEKRETLIYPKSRQHGQELQKTNKTNEEEEEEERKKETKKKSFEEDRF